MLYLTATEKALCNIRSGQSRTDHLNIDTYPTLLYHGDQTEFSRVAYVEVKATYEVGLRNEWLANVV